MAVLWYLAMQHNLRSNFMQNNSACAFEKALSNSKPVWYFVYYPIEKLIMHLEPKIMFWWHPCASTCFRAILNQKTVISLNSETKDFFLSHFYFNFCLLKHSVIEYTRNYMLCGYILSVLTHTTAWD